MNKDIIIICIVTLVMFASGLGKFINKTSDDQPKVQVDMQAEINKQPIKEGCKDG